MPKTVQKFGEAVNDILRKRQWSERRLWQVAKDRGEELSLSTIQAMSDGVVPGPEKVLALARTVDEDPNPLLWLAGWPFDYNPDGPKSLADSDLLALVSGLRPGVARGMVSLPG